MTTIDTHPAGTVCWADLMAPDPAAARTFYGTLLGWTFEIGSADTGHYAFAQVRGKHVAGVGGPPPDAPAPAMWSVYFATDSVDRTVARVQELGGATRVPAMDVLDQGRMAIVADPTGAAFGLWQPNRHTGAQLVDEPGAMCWREVYTFEPERALAFYGQLFGLEPRKLDSPDMAYWTLHKGPLALGGLMHAPASWKSTGIPAHWMTYFAIADVDAAVATAAQLGAQIVEAPMSTPYGRMSVVRDPQGAPFALVTLPRRS